MKQQKALNQFNKIKELKGNMRLAAEEWPSNFQTLIATILSARSLDETTIKTCKILFEKFPDAKDLSQANMIEIQEIIRPINFYINKSKSIANCAKVLEEKYNGIVPEDFNKLIELPGVGSKTANVFLSEIGHDTIGVDTHVSYISQYLGWTKNQIPEKIEQDLKELFPKDYWITLNPTLVKFGKKYTSRIEKNELLDIIKEI